MNCFRPRRLPRLIIPMLACLAIMLTGSLASAQTDTGRIAGVVRDPNGAVVAGAVVTAKNERTRDERTATTDAEGVYQVPALRASYYTVTVTAPNFAANTFTGVQINVGQEQKLDVALSAGGVTEDVTVVAGASEAAIDTGSARMGATVNEREVVGLPLNGRQLSQLYLQAPGSVNSGSGTFGDIRFSGRASNQNAVRYDGVEGSAIIDASPGNLNGEIASPFRLQSSLENVQEFRVDSNNFPAEFGTGTGGQITVISKSGANDVHGSLFEYHRSDRFDAPNYFDIAKSPLTQNQFGASIGLPLKRDRTFLFGSYEGYRLESGVNIVEDVPSAAAWSRAVPAVLPLRDA